MSQNMTLVRRSDVETAEARIAGLGSAALLAAFAVRLAPHSGQNLAPEGLACPQTGQARDSGVPHWARKNLAPVATGALQLEHSTSVPTHMPCAG